MRGGGSSGQTAELAAPKPDLGGPFLATGGAALRRLSTSWCLSFPVATTMETREGPALGVAGRVQGNDAGRVVREAPRLCVLMTLVAVVHTGLVPSSCHCPPSARGPRDRLPLRPQGLFPDPAAPAEGPILHGRSIFARIPLGPRWAHGYSPRLRGGGPVPPKRVQPRSPETRRGSQGPPPGVGDLGWRAFRPLSAEQRRLPAPRARDLDHSDPGEAQTTTQSEPRSSAESERTNPLCVFRLRVRAEDASQEHGKLRGGPLSPPLFQGERAALCAVSLGATPALGPGGQLRGQ